MRVVKKNGLPHQTACGDCTSHRAVSKYHRRGTATNTRSADHTEEDTARLQKLRERQELAVLCVNGTRQPMVLMIFVSATLLLPAPLAPAEACVRRTQLYERAMCRSNWIKAVAHRPWLEHMAGKNIA